MAKNVTAKEGKGSRGRRDGLTHARTHTHTHTQTQWIVGGKTAEGKRRWKVSQSEIIGMSLTKKEHVHMRKDGDRVFEKRRVSLRVWVCQREREQERGSIVKQRESWVSTRAVFSPGNWAGLLSLSVSLCLSLSLSLSLSLFSLAVVSPLPPYTVN